MKRWELKNCVQKSGEGLQNYAADIRRLAQEAYTSTDLEFGESAAANSFVDGICDWKVQSLVRTPSCRNIAAALAYALEVEVARRISCGPVKVHQLGEENPKETKSSSSKGEKTRIITYCATRRQGTSEKKHARLVGNSQLGCDSYNIYIAAWSDQPKKRIDVCVDTDATRSIRRRNLVELRSDWFVNQRERLVLRTATGESSTTLGSVRPKLKLSTSVVEGKFIMADVYDECILRLDLTRKYNGLIVRLRSGLLRAPHGDVPFSWVHTMRGTYSWCVVREVFKKIRRI